MQMHWSMYYLLLFCVSHKIPSLAYLKMKKNVITLNSKN